MRAFSIDARFARTSLSNSPASNAGAFIASATSFSTPPRFARTVSPDAEACVEPPDSETFAFSASSASSNCWRVRSRVPRSSIEPASEPIGAVSLSASSVPKRSRSEKRTTSPRVFFGISASVIPFASFRRSVRASRLAGVGSKASPAATASSPL